MSDPNLPNNAHEARIYLRARQQLLDELLAKIDEDGLNKLSQIVGMIHNKNDKHKKELEWY